MANDYYTNASDVIAGNKAKAEDINSRMGLIEDGFDKLPSCISDAPASKGFDETFTILDSTDEYNPPTSKQIRDGELVYAEDTGTANSIIADLPQAPTAYVTGMSVTIKLNATNTGTTTVNLNGLGAKAVKRISGDELTSGDIIAGRVIGMRYNGTYFQLLDGMYAIHSHGDLYYTKDESDGLLDSKSSTGHTHNELYYTEAEIDTKISNVCSPPVGSVIPYIGGYFSNGSNGGFVSVLGNTADAVNAIVNPYGWNVCNGAALNDPQSPIYNGSGRYLPNLSDDRFIKGDTAAGVSGGSATMAHTHTGGSHKLTTTEMPSHSHSLTINSNGAHSHGFGAGFCSANGNNSNIWGSGCSRDGTHYTDSAGSHSHTGSASSAGSDGYHSHGTTSGASDTNNEPKFVTAIMIKRTR